MKKTNRTNFTNEELNALIQNKKILNLNVENQKLLLLLIPAFLLGVSLDLFLFEEPTNVIAYFPFVVLLGVIFRNYLLILGLTGVLSFVTTVTTTYELLMDWCIFFFIAYIISSLVQNNHKERESLIVLASTLSQSLDKRDPYTSFHSNNVAYYSFELSKALGLVKEDCFHLYLGGLFHDIGKIGTPEHILNKPSTLTDEEYNIIKSHPEQGYEILKDVPYLQRNEILNMVRYHHERFDGRGYPAQLKGYEIPKAARIMAVADSFDAMTSKRAYRKDLDLEYAMNEIEKGKGTQFDPEIADVFLNLLRNNKLEIKGLAISQQPNNYH